MSPAPDDALLPPGFGELRLLSKKLVMWGGIDGRAICALLTLCVSAKLQQRNVSRGPHAGANASAVTASTRHHSRALPPLDSLLMLEGHREPLQQQVLQVILLVGLRHILMKTPLQAEHTDAAINGDKTDFS